MKVDSSDQLKAWIEQNTDPPWSKKEFFLSDYLQTGTSVFSLLLDLKYNI